MPKPSILSVHLVSPRKPISRMDGKPMTERNSCCKRNRGSSTTSDKIRALSGAGYLRAEISKFLNVRYQHVRKVLLDSGITDGLRKNVEFERPPVTIAMSRFVQPS